jgi:hypothetical protein
MHFAIWIHLVVQLNIDTNLRSEVSATMRSNWRDRLSLRIKRFLGINPILCDSCKWDWRSACHNPARPNATSCPEYKKRGT